MNGLPGLGRCFESLKDFEYTSKKGGLQRELGVPLTPTPTVPITRVGVECGTPEILSAPSHPKDGLCDGRQRKSPAAKECGSIDFYLYFPFFALDPFVAKLVSFERSRISLLLLEKRRKSRTSTERRVGLFAVKEGGRQTTLGSGARPT